MQDDKNVPVGFVLLPKRFLETWLYHGGKTRNNIQFSYAWDVCHY